MKLEDLKSKNIDQLKASLLEFKKEAFNLRFQKANGQLENTSRVRTVRRSVARIITLMKQKSEKG
ncbi:MAG: 50S ribosomal protein L29 [Rhodobacteraceae bacterium]|nr:50S ribosomal protein L29 [Paracoccaceae bacterium]|tara:strand:+ start:582 stop:776 length:195 start_codon:yes stop_codon:yes gene_type:complete